MLTIAFRITEGKYSVYVNNDAVVTKGWIKSLYDCVTSDPDIICACPCTSNTSNSQSVLVSYDGLEEFHEFAESFNVQNPAKWHRRARLMPVIAMYENRLVNKIGLTDRCFKTFEFWDDDFSLRARRKGYLQILCKDFVCHHYGSVTTKEGYVKENTLDRGRRLFMHKNGVDAWSVGANYNVEMTAEIQKQFMPDKSSANILGIDCGFGDTLLQIGNILREDGISSKIYSTVRNEAYRPDLEAISDEFYFAEGNFEKSAEALFSGAEFDYIVVESRLESYGDWRQLLRSLACKLTAKGILMLTLSNRFFIGRLEQSAQNSQSVSAENISNIDINEVRQFLESLSLHSHGISLFDNYSGIDEYINKNFGTDISENKRRGIASVISTEHFVVFCYNETR